MFRYIIVFVKRSSSTNIVQKSDLSQFLETTLSLQIHWELVQLYKSEVYSNGRISSETHHFNKPFFATSFSCLHWSSTYIKSLPKKILTDSECFQQGEHSLHFSSSSPRFVSSNVTGVPLLLSNVDLSQLIVFKSLLSSENFAEKTFLNQYFRSLWWIHPSRSSLLPKPRR